MEVGEERKMSFGKRRTRILDGEELFKHYYITMGDGRSYNKLARWASGKWGVNPETGRDWTTGAVWQSAWRWALDEQHPENLVEAKKIYRDVVFEYFLKVEKAVNPDLEWSDELFEEEWADTVSTHAKTCMTDPQYRRFMNKNPEFKKFEVL